MFVCLLLTSVWATIPLMWCDVMWAFRCEPVLCFWYNICYFYEVLAFCLDVFCWNSFIVEIIIEWGAPNARHLMQDVMFLFPVIQSFWVTLPQSSRLWGHIEIFFRSCSLYGSLIFVSSVNHSYTSGDFNCKKMTSLWTPCKHSQTWIQINPR